MRFHFQNPHLLGEDGEGAADSQIAAGEAEELHSDEDGSDEDEDEDEDGEVKDKTIIRPRDESPESKRVSHVFRLSCTCTRIDYKVPYSL